MMIIMVSAPSTAYNLAASALSWDIDISAHARIVKNSTAQALTVFTQTGRSKPESETTSLG